MPLLLDMYIFFRTRFDLYIQFYHWPLIRNVFIALLVEIFYVLLDWIIKIELKETSQDSIRIAQIVRIV